MRLGCRDNGREGVDSNPPSMRPRRVRLGCPNRRAQGPPAYRAFNEAEARAPRMHQSQEPETITTNQPSMRPRRVRLGCPRLSGKVPFFPRAFNEAEARAPRMRRTPRPPIAGAAPFNEAEARAPRMQDLAVVVAPMSEIPRAGLPSMRPRRVRLGCAPSRRLITPCEGACGMRSVPALFNEAEARAPRMRARDVGHPSDGDPALQ